MITLLWRLLMNVDQRIFSIVADRVGIDVGSLTPFTSFSSDLGMDSCDFIEFIMDVEDEFTIDIDDDTAATFITLRDVIDYVLNLAK
jgi:acyl carrier protein